MQNVQDLSFVTCSHCISSSFYSVILLDCHFMLAFHLNNFSPSIQRESVRELKFGNYIQKISDDIGVVKEFCHRDHLRNQIEHCSQHSCSPSSNNKIIKAQHLSYHHCTDTFILFPVFLLFFVFIFFNFFFVFLCFYLFLLIVFFQIL